MTVATASAAATVRVAKVATVTATATCTAFTGVVEGTGECLNARTLAARVGWLADLVGGITEALLAEHWTPEGLAALSSPGVDGRRLPSSGWMTMRRLGWPAVPPVGVVVSDRVRRIGQEHAARLLRLGAHREAILVAVLGSWPVDPTKRTDVEWARVRGAVPSGTTNVEIRGRTRQAGAYLKAHDRLPVSVTEAEEPPHAAAQVLLAAADRQQVTVRRDGQNAVLRVLLPTCPAPGAYRDWVWVTMPVRIPTHVPGHADLHTPTLRVVAHRVRVDLPWTVPAPPVRLDGHVQALGVDWGLNTLLTATLGRVNTETDSRERVTSTGRPLMFNATGVAAKLVRLRRIRERIRIRLDHLDRLLAGHSDAALTLRRDRLGIEHDRVCARIRNLNKALAWAAARWALDHAQVNGATAIYVEDLASMEPRGMGRTLNRTLSGQVRGAVFDALTHLAAKVGVAVVTVPARGTSKFCPRCGRKLRHHAAPDNRTSGHKWSHCVCGLSSDRDHAAAERILARGLLGQASAHRTRNGTLVTTKVVEGPVRRVTSKPKPRRDKTSPTPNANRLTPSRRQVPAPAATLVAGQRPAGRTPQAYSMIVGQVPTRNPMRHTPRGWLRGRGFHLHVQATAPPSHAFVGF